MARPTTGTARYELCREDPETGKLSAWQWLVLRNPNLGKNDGTPNLTRIAEGGGVDLSTISTLWNGKTQLGIATMAALTKVGMSTGVSRSTAERYLFDFVEHETKAVAA